MAAPFQIFFPSIKILGKLVVNGITTLTGNVEALGLLATGAAGSGLGFKAGAGGAVTQVTSAATAVTLNKHCGQITTVALTTAAAAEEVFVVNNSLVSAADVIAVSTTYAGAGTPIVAVKGVGAGAFSIVITNLHAANALDAVLVINFVVLQSAAS